ncbi:Short-chain dehydrogenase/reductase SDR [Candidatus Methylobacter favarea]|uniref:Short-chain dehydrogenase/reductase SDR n=1 Tax=Candidatus Methylobacter favarea TaxID=2707345 RepID=A0A8S0WKZ9_9GAMM|nr:SDR family oxidoreductase [Candidatus Methylobacter favarea]CAA9892310.1 Short-chain dehydrogenase/reductase SDR [Candidatus Methylobacter favarea]
MATVLITGSNRGLGLEFCRQYAREGWDIIACCRKPEQAFKLDELVRQYNTIRIEALDVADFSQIDALSQKLSDCCIDVLINNAGVYKDHREHVFGKLDYQAWTETLLVNTLSPVKMAEAFLPQIQRSEKKLIASISSLMGSMADNDAGGSIFYRSSKAALNAAMKSLAIDLKGQSIGVLIFHPGWVKTDMGGTNALINADESVSGMRSVINSFSLEHSGSFIKYDGALLPW